MDEGVEFFIYVFGFSRFNVEFQIIIGRQDFFHPSSFILHPFQNVPEGNSKSVTQRVCSEKLSKYWFPVPEGNSKSVTTQNYRIFWVEVSDIHSKTV